MKFIIGLLLTIGTAEAYTLNNNFGASFKDNNVKVRVAGNTVCTPANSGITPGELEDMIKPAVDKFWNKVPTSALVLDASGASEAINNINLGRLCSPTDQDCINDGTADPNGLIPPVTDIIIACNSNPDNFGSNNVLAVTIPNKFSGKKIVGAVILINDFAPTFGSLSTSDKISVLAHEIGHAIGLGHSEDSAALMYYRTVSLRTNLGQDDVDGVTYLYPMHVDAFGLSGGLLGSCGTIQNVGGKDDEPPSNPPFVQMGISLGLMILIAEAYRLFKRTKTSSAF
ncbi:matrixin family metalloprotease [Peredibacter sp. HCB2-198]|uniref:matrixin family metalloprotease n=1 Tax=Peredibacter sp. HCB2-198 TaxID=3383025 RepID=UPI0038B5D30A